MEKIMAVNFENAKERETKEKAQTRKAGHLAVLLEVFKDVRRQWSEAEYGRSFS